MPRYFIIRHNYTSSHNFFLSQNTPSGAFSVSLHIHTAVAPILNPSDGQTKGEFGQFNVYVMASAITGAIGEYMLLATPNITTKIDLESYSAELVKIFDKAIMNEVKA